MHRYLSQARELEKLAGADKVIQIETCESPKAGDLLRILGYRMRGGCGSEVVLETVNATRAFLTTDSGFPLAELEQALRTNRPFTYDYHPAARAGPVRRRLLAVREGKGERRVHRRVSLADPALCRLYLGLSKLDRETAEELRKNIPVPRLKAYAHVLDFFGGMFEIRDGKAVVPGGARSEAAWAELAGVSPDKGAAFFEKLMAKDDGWLASYFDALARINGPVQGLSDRARAPEALLHGDSRHGHQSGAGAPGVPLQHRHDAADHAAAHGSRRQAACPRQPGGLEEPVRRTIRRASTTRKLTRAAAGWKDPDDVLEALFGLCRKAVENEPLKIFMALSDLDRYRAKPLDAGDRGPAGARVPHVRQPVRHLQRRRHRERQVHRRSSWTRPTRSAA